jgi:hypothetical protein
MSTQSILVHYRHMSNAPVRHRDITYFLRHLMATQISASETTQVRQLNAGGLKVSPTSTQLLEPEAPRKDQHVPAINIHSSDSSNWFRRWRMHVSEDALH